MLLKFSPVAWQKLRFFLMNKDKVEIAGFGITTKDDPTVISDFELVKSKSEPTFVDIDQDSLLDYVEAMDDRGYSKDECFRIWIHTHPNMKPFPSLRDRKTFNELKALCPPWFAMIIVSTKEEWYGEIGYSKGPDPSASYEIELDIDWSYPIDRIVDFEDLQKQYEEKVEIVKPKSKFIQTNTKVALDNPNGIWGRLPTAYQEKAQDIRREKGKERAPTPEELVKVEKSYDDDLWGRYDKDGIDDEYPELTEKELNDYRIAFQEMSEEEGNEND